jgi:hypothetical protein
MEADAVAEESAGTPLNGGVIARGKFVVEERVLGEQGEPERIEAMVEQVDDDHLGGDE